MVAHSWDPSTQEVEASEIQGRPWSHGEFEVSLSYTRHCLKIQKQGWLSG